jgi:hypothetical protein
MEKMFKISANQRKAIGESVLSRYIISKDDTLKNSAMFLNDTQMMEAVSFIDTVKKSNGYKCLEYAQAKKKYLRTICSKIENNVLKRYAFEVIDRKANKMYAKLLYITYSLHFVPFHDSKERAYKIVRTVTDQDGAEIEHETVFNFITEKDYFTQDDLFAYYDKANVPMPNKLMDIVLEMNESFKSGKKEGIQEFVKSAKCIGLTQMKDDHRKYLQNVLKAL